MARPRELNSLALSASSPRVEIGKAPSLTLNVRLASLPTRDEAIIAAHRSLSDIARGLGLTVSV